MERKLRTGILVGSTRQNRQGERVAAWARSLAAERPEIEPVLVDLKEWPLPFYDQPMPPKAIEARYESELARRWVKTIESLDAFVIVTPEYNHGYPAALKNALDWAYAGWNGKPVAFVSYGGTSGGVRAVEQLRLVAIELQMAPVRDEVNIPMVFQAFDEQGAPKDAHHARRAAAMLDQLVWWGRALAEARARVPYPGVAPAPAK